MMQKLEKSFKFFRRELLVVLLLVLLGCNEPFTPNGPYDDRMVIYAILSTQTKTHIVRVYDTYNPSNYDPYSIVADNPITDAVVRIEAPGLRLQARDTLIPRKDKSRYSSDIRAYVFDTLTVSSGTTYSLSVASPTRGTVTASAAVPGKANLLIDNYALIEKPYLFANSRNEDQDIFLTILLSPIARGFLAQLFLEYQVVENNTKVTQRAEIPSLAFKIGLDSLHYVYPKLTRRSAEPFTTFTQPEVARFSIVAYRNIASDIQGRYGSGNVTFKNAIFFVTQAERNLYNYYNIANGFQDPFSIRTDFPDFTNINGGVGVFGAFSVDSLFVQLPATFP